MKTQTQTKIAVQMSEVRHSFIKAVGYDAGTKSLYITFPNGKTFRYWEVKSVTVSRLLKAERKGHYYHQNIRDQYSSTFAF